jgi:putative flippase GtrA
MKLVDRKISKIVNGEQKHIIRFAIVGAGNTLVDFLCFSVFQSIFGFSYLLSQALGYCCGIMNSFVLNRSWTFRDKNTKKPTFYELLQFAIVNGITLSVSVIGMKLLVKDLNMNMYLSKIVITLAAQLINYVGYKLWVFNPAKPLKHQLHW